jgi:glycosyltransferase involved in cell wall biosynthesis
VSVESDPDRVAAYGRRFDVGHCPFQPDQLDVAAWRGSCDRIVVSMLDLISYQMGSYHRTAHEWLAYREAIRDGVDAVDGVVAISDDVRRSIERERLPVDPSRLFVVPLGTEHLTGDEPRSVPAVLERPELVAQPFLLSLGTNYGHKNRDLAIRVRDELAARGCDLLLVLAGVSVLSGTSRVAEARALAGGVAERVVILPEVTSEERNWLLAHARLVLYPTTAEGFGLVPFEVARFGTPTVAVPFGPLQELGAVGDVAPRTWAVSDLADAAHLLLTDPDAARRSVDEVLTAGARLSWADCASGILDCYRWVLDRPPRTAKEEL